MARSPYSQRDEMRTPALRDVVVKYQQKRSGLSYHDGRVSQTVEPARGPRLHKRKSDAAPGGGVARGLWLRASGGVAPGVPLLAQGVGDGLGHDLLADPAGVLLIDAAVR